MSPPRAPSISTDKTTGNFLRKNYGEELAWSRSGLIFFPATSPQIFASVPAQRGETVSDEEVQRLLDQVGLSGFTAQDVSVLSGGEQQRVSLARTLANRPEVLLLDEPTSALDEQSKLGIEDLVTALVRDHGLTCVLVTHDRDQARRVCPRVIVLEAGRLVRSGTAMEVLGA